MMDLAMLLKFLGWCTLFSGGLLILTTLWVVAAPDLMFRLQTRFFPMTRERYDQSMYLFLGVFKIVFLVFNLVPYLALRIIA